MFSALWSELKAHLPYTLGITIVMTLVFGIVSLFRQGPWQEIEFESVHMGHIFISAIASSAVAYRMLRSWAIAMSVGVVFSIAFCTFSDAVLPNAGIKLFGFGDSGESVLEELLENTVFVLFFAVVGSFIGMARTGKFRVSIVAHSLHTLMSVVASLIYVLAKLAEFTGTDASWFTWAQTPAVMVTLFISVFLPCVLSDVVMPVAVVLSGKRLREKLAG